MRRIAAHYIYWKELLPLHYIELDDNDLFVGVYPLCEEIAGTVFKDGIIFPTLDTADKIKSLADLKTSGITDSIKAGHKVVLNQLL
jgi:hypothetical protein